MDSKSAWKFVLTFVLASYFSARAQPNLSTKEIVMVPFQGADPALWNAWNIWQTAKALSDAGGGTLYLGAGIYPLKPRPDGYVKAIWLQNLKNVRVRGDGEATILRQDTDTSASIAQNLINLENCQNITFENLRIEGVPLTNLNGEGDHTAIQADGGSDLHVLGCSFKGFKTGAVVYQGGVTRSSVENCFFEQVDNHNTGDYGAIHLSNTSDILIRANQFWRLRFSGVSISSGGKRIHILDNIMRFDLGEAVSGSMGIFITEGIQNCIFAHNRMYGAKNESMDIRTKGSSNFPIQDNIISENIMQSRFTGITLNPYRTDDPGIPEATNNSVTRNIISGYVGDSGLVRVQHGILSSGLNSNIISGNVISKCEIAGINMQDTPNLNIINSNLIEDVLGQGITAYRSMIVSNNFLKTISGPGISVNYTMIIGQEIPTHISVTGNLFSNTAVRVIKGESVQGETLLDNCDMNGLCANP